MDRRIEEYINKPLLRGEFLSRLIRLTGSTAAALTILSPTEAKTVASKSAIGTNMKIKHQFHQLDVFTDQPLLGNALAVVHNAQNLDERTLAGFAQWTNLSETAFLFPPTQAGADYKVRIFTTEGELPFAGHPTLGSCNAWLVAGGKPKSSGFIVQECGVGLVKIRKDKSKLAFAAPPLQRTGDLDEKVLVQIIDGLGIRREDIVLHQWIDNGPGWCAVLLKSAEQVLSLHPDFGKLSGLALGVVAPQPKGSDTDFEVRAFISPSRIPEDPVTGSLNAGIAQWLIPAGRAKDHYVVSQGAALQRKGRVYIDRVGNDIWVGGNSVVCIEGTVSI